MSYIIEVEKGILNCYGRVGDSHYTFSVLPFECKVSALTFVFDWKRSALDASENYEATGSPHGIIKQIKYVEGYL
jgi:hypothetical protein